MADERFDRYRTSVRDHSDLDGAVHSVVDADEAYPAFAKDIRDTLEHNGRTFPGKLAWRY